VTPKHGTHVGIPRPFAFFLLEGNPIFTLASDIEVSYSARVFEAILS
jgi:hypothetical protein